VVIAKYCQKAQLMEIELFETHESDINKIIR
jgi:hypothetical protein